MSRNSSFYSANEILTSDDDIVENNLTLMNSIDASNSSNGDISTNQITEDHGWANFGTFENNVNTESNDEWADFKTSAMPSPDQSIDISSNRINTDDDDVFADYGEVKESPKYQTSSFSLNFLNMEEIESLISTCFPLESSILCTDNTNFIPFELPNFRTCNDQIKQTSCFQPSLNLWNVLSNVSNDPLGIKYQWRKSNTEQFFHQGLDVRERFPTKTNLSTPEISSSNAQTTSSNESKLSSQSITPQFDWKKSGLENPLTVYDINKTLDLDYYIPPIQTSPSSSSTVVYRNDSPILHRQSTSIKTVDLFPGSTTVLNDDTKPVMDTLPNFSFMNPKALMF
ncbi:unnamed protein product [Adineta steineri]|uniref:Aftiphilin clathrin-binding box domain-containing protein n=1 Tax=Adineta steineri TaxID=433720 RepID=A0A815IP50_9BILA|nr:unnamed protein product [Adineta steineri]CAF3951991.1 unnamed protein product [Adineta steineri]